MDTSRAKWILIVILLASNLVLGTVLAVRALGAERAEREMLESLELFLEEKGISFNAELSEEVAYPCEALMITKLSDAPPDSFVTLLDENYLVRGKPVFPDESLDGLRVYIVDSPQVSSGVPGITLATAVVSLANRIPPEGQEITEISSARLGYYARSVGGKYISFIPAWELTTDAGVLMVIGSDLILRYGE